MNHDAANETIGVPLNLHISEERTVNYLGGERVFHEPTPTCEVFECDKGVWIPLAQRDEARQEIAEHLYSEHEHEDGYSKDDAWYEADSILALLGLGDTPAAP